MKFIDHKKPLETFDRIEIIKKEDLENLLAWRDNNKDVVRNFKFVIERGLIVNKFNGIHMVFEKQDDDSIYIDTLMMKNGSLQHFLTIKWFYKNFDVRILHPEEDFVDQSHVDNCQSMITVVASLLAFMEHNKENREYIKQKNVLTSEKSIKKSNNKKKNKGSKKKVKKISRTFYSFSVDRTQKLKRDYQFKEDKGWKVEGHWRYFKNGTKTWIKPYTKGNKEKVEPSIYKL